MEQLKKRLAAEWGKKLRDFYPGIFTSVPSEEIALFLLNNARIEHAMTRPRAADAEQRELYRIEIEYVPAEEEKVEREKSAHAVFQRNEWMRGDKKLPPPDSVRFLDLLDQDRWWRTRNLLVTELDDMDPKHRLGLLKMLKRNSFAIHSNASITFSSAPEPVYEQFMSRDPWEWLKGTTLVKRLRKLAQEDKESGALD